MKQPDITFVINGKAYSLGAGDAEAIGAIPAAERQQLIALLEAVKQQEVLANEIARGALEAGVSGMLYWTYDTFEQPRLHHAASDWPLFVKKMGSLI